MSCTLDRNRRNCSYRKQYGSRNRWPHCDRSRCIPHCSLRCCMPRPSKRAWRCSSNMPLRRLHSCSCRPRAVFRIRRQYLCCNCRTNTHSHPSRSCPPGKSALRLRMNRPLYNCRSGSRRCRCSARSRWRQEHRNCRSRCCRPRCTRPQCNLVWRWLNHRGYRMNRNY